MSRFIFTSLCAALILSACQAAPHETETAQDSPAVAAPDLDTQKFPTDFRRVSLIVNDIDESLRFYRDILGFQVNYDTEVTMSGVALTRRRTRGKSPISARQL